MPIQAKRTTGRSAKKKKSGAHSFDEGKKKNGRFSLSREGARAGGHLGSTRGGEDREGPKRRKQSKIYLERLEKKEGAKTITQKVS